MRFVIRAAMAVGLLVVVALALAAIVAHQSPGARDARMARAALRATIPAATEVKLDAVYWRRGCLIGRAAFPGMADVSPGWHVFAVDRAAPGRAIIPTADPEAVSGPLAPIIHDRLQAELMHCLTVPLA